MENLLAHMGYGAVAGSGVPCGGEDAARWSPSPRVREKPEVMAAQRAPGTPLHCGAAAGPGPSTSEKAQAEATARKDAAEASSPKTPLDYAAAAESGASSGGEDGAARSPAKRKAPGGSGPGAGGGSSSDGNEAGSSPVKGARADAAAASDQATSAADKVEVEKLIKELPTAPSDSSIVQVQC